MHPGMVLVKLGEALQQFKVESTGIKAKEWPTIIQLPPNRPIDIEIMRRMGFNERGRRFRVEEKGRPTEEEEAQYRNERRCTTPVRQLPPRKQKKASTKSTSSTSTPTTVPTPTTPTLVPPPSSKGMTMRESLIKRLGQKSDESKQQRDLHIREQQQQRERDRERDRERERERERERDRQRGPTPPIQKRKRNDGE